MKIKIESDVYDIVNRIKEIDDGYFIVYDTNKNVYELHNSKQENTYCLSVTYGEIDSRLIDMIYATSVKYIDKIIEDIDKNNNDIEERNLKEVKDESDYKVREIYKFESNSSKGLDDELFKNNWR